MSGSFVHRTARVAECIALDPAVQAVLLNLERAMTAVALRYGESLTSLAVTWVTQDGKDEYSGAICCGDIDPAATAFMAAALVDESDDHPLPAMTRGLQ